MARKFLLLLALLGMALPAFGLNCYYGITDDSEDDPEDDWDELCNYEEDDPLVPEEGCKVSCDGPNAACFKIKFKGDEDFYSIYGCTIDYENPTGANSLIPGVADGFTADTIQLAELPEPDEEEDCVEKEDVDQDDLPEDLDGDEVMGTWCTCEESNCNGAGVAAGSMAAAAFATLLAACL